MSLNIAPLFGDAVNIGRFEAHHAMAVGADIPHADVITHDDEDVGLLGLLCCRWQSHQHRGGDARSQHAESRFDAQTHNFSS
jgi:hypothetical protein